MAAEKSQLVDYKKKNTALPHPESKPKSGRTDVKKKAAEQPLGALPCDAGRQGVLVVSHTILAEVSGCPTFPAAAVEIQLQSVAGVPCERALASYLRRGGNTE